MKKFCCAMILIIMMMCQSVNIFAYNEVKKIDVYYGAPYANISDVYGNYTIVNKNEIQMVIHLLESLKTIPGGGMPTDTQALYFMITCKDNPSQYITQRYDMRCDVCPSAMQIVRGNGVEPYKISVKEYYQLCGFINSLILDKFDNDEPISTTPSEWAESDIESMIEAGMLSKWHQIGYANKVSRAEVCQLIDDILIAKGIYEDTNIKSVFDDTDDIAVNRLYEEGIVSGISETEFDPYDYITREEFATILSRTYDFLGLSSRTEIFRYADENDISEWAQDSVNKMYAAGLMQGKDNNEFKPKDTVTKQEVIVALRRLADLIYR